MLGELPRFTVLHVITGLNRGGAERQLQQLLRDNTVSQSVFSLTETHAMRAEMDTWASSVTTGKSSAAAPFHWWHHLSSRIREESPDIVVGWMYHGNLAAQAMRLAGFRGPVIWNVRHSLSDLLKETRRLRATIRAGALLSSTATHVVFNSHTARKQHERIGFDVRRSTIIPNGIDLNRFKPSAVRRQETREELSISPETRLIGVVGRSHPMKNHVGWLHIFAQLVADHPHLHCVIVGSDVRADLATTVQNLGLQQHVHLMEEHHHLEFFYPALDLLVVPSLWGEAFPNVIGEAMATGVPVVATPLGDVPQIVGDQGFVTRDVSNDSLRRTVQKAISYLEAGYAGQRVSLTPRSRAALFDLPIAHTKYRQLYEQVMLPTTH